MDVIKVFRVTSISHLAEVSWSYEAQQTNISLRYYEVLGIKVGLGCTEDYVDIFWPWKLAWNWIRGTYDELGDCSPLLGQNALMHLNRFKETDVVATAPRRNKQSSEKYIGFMLPKPT